MVSFDRFNKRFIKAWSAHRRVVASRIVRWNKWYGQAEVYWRMQQILTRMANAPVAKAFDQWCNSLVANSALGGEIFELLDDAKLALSCLERFESWPSRPLAVQAWPCQRGTDDLVVQHSEGFGRRPGT